MSRLPARAATVVATCCGRRRYVPPSAPSWRSRSRGGCPTIASWWSAARIPTASRARTMPRWSMPRALPNVEMRGFVPFSEAEGWFNGARLVLNTSLYEGFPNTFLQAWSRGTPTVAFVDTGSRTPDGAPVYDAVRDVAQACWKVERLMRDDILWREASRRVLAYYRGNHSIDATIDRYEREIALLTASR